MHFKKPVGLLEKELGSLTELFDCGYQRDKNMKNVFENIFLLSLV